MRGDDRPFDIERAVANVLAPLLKEAVDRDLPEEEFNKVMTQNALVIIADVARFVVMFLNPQTKATPKDIQMVLHAAGDLFFKTMAN